MPYTSLEKAHQVMRDSYQSRYHGEEGFAEAERARQRAIYEANREKAMDRVRARRARLKAAKDAERAKATPSKR